MTLSIPGDTIHYRCFFTDRSAIPPSGGSCTAGDTGGAEVAAMMNTDGEVRLTDLIPVDTLQKIHMVTSKNRDTSRFRT